MASSEPGKKQKSLQLLTYSARFSLITPSRSRKIVDTLAPIIALGRSCLNKEVPCTSTVLTANAVLQPPGRNPCGYAHQWSCPYPLTRPGQKSAQFLQISIG